MNHGEYKEDYEIWEKLPHTHLWLYDKLIVSKTLGYVCGPKGLTVPEAKLYVVRPITNMLGMSIGTSYYYIKDDTDYLPDGTFWCEMFTGRHLSVDYYNGEQKLCVEGFKDYIRFNKWQKVYDKIPYPDFLSFVDGWVNIEFIGGKIIEIHLRRNPDFVNHNYSVLYPVYRGQRIPENFIKDKEHDRIGFQFEE